MEYIKSEIIRAANSVNIHIRELSIQEYTTLVNTIIGKYTEQISHALIWQNMRNYIAVQNSDAWSWIDQFISGTQSILFIEDEELMFEFDNGEELVKLLYESYHFEFYITNESADYLICFNHHDYLIAAGTALPWLQNRLDT